MPKIQSMRSQEIFLGYLAIGLPSENRVRAETSAVQDFAYRPPYICRGDVGQQTASRTTEDSPSLLFAYFHTTIPQV